MTVQLSNIAERVTLSQKKQLNDIEGAHEKRQSLPAKTTLRGEVKRFTADGAEFIDGTQETFDAIIYATG